MTTIQVNPGGSSGVSFKNALINGSFHINQRLPASNADDSYAHDRWYVLTQSGTIAVSTLTDVENTTPRMARLTQSQAGAQRMGYAQIIEGKNCKHLRGQQVTFRMGRYRCSAAQAIRFAVLEWTGTEDSVTSDVVNDWTNGTYTAGNFFLAANLTISGVTSETPAAATLTTGPALTVTLGSSFNNLIVLVWTEGTAAQNVTLDLGKAQLESGGSASTFEVIPFTVLLALCQRYYEKSDLLETAPLTNTQAHFTVTAIANDKWSPRVEFKVRKRAAPTIRCTDGTTVGNANWDQYGTSNVNLASFGTNIDEEGFGIRSTATNSLAATNTNFGWDAAAEL